MKSALQGSYNYIPVRSAGLHEGKLGIGNRVTTPPHYLLDRGTNKSLKDGATRALRHTTPALRSTPSRGSTKTETYPGRTSLCTMAERGRGCTTCHLPHHQLRHGEHLGTGDLSSTYISEDVAMDIVTITLGTVCLVTCRSSTSTRSVLHFSHRPGQLCSLSSSQVHGTLVYDWDDGCVSTPPTAVQAGGASSVPLGRTIRVSSTATADLSSTTPYSSIA